MTKDIFSPDLLSTIDEELIAESEIFVRGIKTASPLRGTRRLRTLLIAAVLLILSAAAIGVYYIADGVLPPDTANETTSDLPPEGVFIIENGILLSYSGNETEVTVPEGVTTIAANAFSGNTSIKILALSSTVADLEDGCLLGCEALEEVRVADGGAISSSAGLVLSADGKSVIYVNKAEVAEHLVIPEGVESLKALFAGCKTLISVKLPMSLSEIPERAFADCENLEKAELGGVRLIGKEAFSSCFKLSYVDLGETRNVSSLAFSDCNALSEVKMTYVTRIYDRAFANCGLKGVDFGKRLTRIDQLAFASCNQLTEIVLPETLEAVDATAFRGCSIRKVTYKGSNEEWNAAKTTFFGINAIKNYELIFLDEDPEYVETVQQFISNGDGTCTVKPSRNKEESGVIIIPAVSPAGDTVTSISGFAGCKNMTAIILPETVTSIAGAAFSGCDSLVRVEAPGVKQLGTRSFASCSELTEVILSPALTEIPESAFVGCTKLVALPLHEGLLRIGESAFSKVGATHVVFPSTLIEIGESAFNACVELVSVDMSKSALKSISRQSFFGCPKLTEIIFPKTLEQIALMAFSDCPSIRKINLPEGLRSIGDMAFARTALTEVVIPDSVTTLKSAFRFCDNLRTLTLGKGITVFEALGNCIAIESYVIPDTVTSIGYDAFSGCINLREVVIPDTVTAIDANAFKECKSLASIVIPDSVKSIGNGAFAGCSSLSNIKLSENLTSIEGAAFNYCISLVSLKLPNSLKAIGDGCFANCISLAEISMPSKLDELGSRAFAECTSLKSIKLSEGLTLLGEDTFNGCTSLKSITFPSTLTAISQNCFFGCSALESLTFPKSLKVIAGFAFKDCTALKSISFNEGLETIAGYAFSGCVSLTEVTIPASITSINFAFADCTSIRKVTFAAGSVCSVSWGTFTSSPNIEEIVLKDPSKLELDFQCFANLTNLKRVVIEKGTLFVPSACFAGCTSLSEIDFSKITFIENSAFARCTSLPSEIRISSLVPVIGAYAFEGCTSIEKVICSPYIRIIDESAFSGCTSLREITIGIGTYAQKNAFKDCTALERINYPGTEEEFNLLLNTIESSRNEYASKPINYLNNITAPKGYKLNRKAVTFKSDNTVGYILLDPSTMTFEIDELVNIYTGTEGYLIAEGDKYDLVMIYGYYYLIEKADIN